MAFNVSAKPMLSWSLCSLYQFFPCAVILQEFEVYEDCSMVLLKAPETTLLHPTLQVLLHFLLMDGLRVARKPDRLHEWLHDHQKTSQEAAFPLLRGTFEHNKRDQAVNPKSWYVHAGTLKADLLTQNRQRYAWLWKLESRGCGGTSHTKEDPLSKPMKQQMSPTAFVV